MSRHSKVIARTDTQTDSQTDTQTDTDAHTLRQYENITFPHTRVVIKMIQRCHSLFNMYQNHIMLSPFVCILLFWETEISPMVCMKRLWKLYIHQ